MWNMIHYQTSDKSSSVCTDYELNNKLQWAKQSYSITHPTKSTGQTQTQSETHK